MNPVYILLIIIGVFGLIALLAYIIHRVLNPKLKEDKPDEEQFVQEELDRVLQPIEDEETANAVNSYVDKEDEEPKKDEE